MVDGKYIANRITALRIQKNVSEYKMSLDMGHSSGYVQSISSGRAMPSMGEFLYMCEYFGITPEEFFAEENKNPILLNRLTDFAQSLSEENLNLLVSLAEKLSQLPQK